MILKKLIASCNRNKTVYICMDEKGHRYLSDGNVYGLLDAGAEFDVTDILAFLQISDEMIDNYTIGEQLWETDSGYTHQINTKASQITRLPLGLYIDTALAVFDTKKGLCLAEMDQISIFKDAGIREYHLSELYGDDVILVVKDSIVIGMIRPIRMELEKLQSLISVISHAVDVAIKNNFNNCEYHQYELDFEGDETE